MAYQTPLTVKETLDRVDQGRLVLPAIQREFVWVSDLERMTRLFDSLLRQYPIGTFLFWDVPSSQSREFDFYEVMRTWHERDRRHNPRVHLTTPRDLTAVLDGQQRLTTLNIGLRGDIATRARYKRASSSDAYPRRQLYVDLRFTPGEDDDIAYRFAFLTAEQAAGDAAAHWYRAGDILDVSEPGLALWRYLREHALTDDERPFEVLDRLWGAVHRDGVVSAFEEKGEKLSRVLDIFVRVNSGGVVLSKSDLLLSMATAHFRTRDAREEIHQLVDELNAEGSGFTFSKDLILKAGLVLTGISDIGFRVENFTTANMAILETNWDRLADALRAAVRLLSSFGLSAATLPANSVLIPVADYVYARELGQRFLDSQAPAVRADRAAVRTWVLRTIVMPGVWGSGLDGLLRGLHKVVAESHGAFPSVELEAEMARRGKALQFTDELIDDLTDTPYRHPRAFALLTLLYETVDTLSRFHVDHVFPRAQASAARLGAAGLSTLQVQEVQDKVERLANLQLLHGPVNIDKQGQLPAAWIRARFPEQRAREAWLAENDLLSVPEDATEFISFYAERRELIRARITALLSRPGTTHPPSSAPDTAGPAGGGRPPEPPPPARVASSPEPAQQRSATPQTPPTAGPRPAATVRKRARFDESLRDLIDDGRLSVGQQLHATYRGTQYVAQVEQGGLRLDGRVYDDPSPAGWQVTGGSVNGWKLWRLADGREIGTLRRH